MRYCWTLVMATGLIGLNTAGWMSYQSKPRAVPPVPVSVSPTPEPPKNPPDKEKPKPPEGETRPITTPVVKVDDLPKKDATLSPKDKTKPKDPPDPPKRPEPPTRYTEAITAGETAFKAERWLDAIKKYDEAAKAWDMGREAAETKAQAARSRLEGAVSKLVVEVRELIGKKEYARAREGVASIKKHDPNATDIKNLNKDIVSAEVAGLLGEARTYIRDKNYPTALNRVTAALTLDAENEDARTLQAEIKRLSTPMPMPIPTPSRKLAGDVLILIVHTPTTSLTTPEFRIGLEGAEKEMVAKNRLLGGHLWILDANGVRPWSTTAKLDDKAALDNRDFKKLIQAMNTAVTKLETDAVKKEFRVVLVWETDNTVPNAMALKPRDRFRLAYRYTLGDTDLVPLQHTFGLTNRFRNPGSIRVQVTDLATREVRKKQP